MKILEDNSERLVLSQGPSPAGIILAVLLAAALWFSAFRAPDPMQGVLFWLPAILGAAVLLFVFAQSTRLTLDSRTGEFSLRKFGPLGPRSRRLDIGTLAGATLQLSPGGAGSGKKLRAALVLKTPSGLQEVPLSTGYSGGPGPEKAAEAINRWLTRRR